MNYTVLTDIRDAAIRLHLDGSQHLAYLPIDVLSAAYNGTGPEFLPLTALPPEPRSRISSTPPVPTRSRSRRSRRQPARTARTMESSVKTS